MPNKAAAICVFGLFKRNQSDKENEMFLNGNGHCQLG